MALNGTLKKDSYGEYFKLIVDWSTVQHPANKTNQFTFKIYLDSSSAYSMSKVASTSGKSYISISGSRIYFTTASVSGVGEHLLATIKTDAIITGNPEFSFYMRMYFDEDVKVKKNILSSDTFSNVVFNTTHFTVDTFPEKSTMTVSGDRVLTLNNDLVNTIVVTKNDSRYRHSIEYTCGKETVSVCEKSSDGNMTVNLPISLACQNTSGMTVTVKFKITTLWTDDGVVGTQTVSVDYAIPDIEETKPHCTIEVTDGEHRNNVQLVNKYGAFVQGYSRFNIKVTPILAYDSPIVSCTIKANDETHVDYYELETKFLKHAGEQDIIVSLTDKRGRSNEFTVTKNVLEYLKPYVNILGIDRCDSAGTIDDSGDHIKVTFDAEITSLKNLNSATYKLEYMTSAGTEQHEVNLTEFTGQYNIKGGTYKFKADSSNTYSVTLTATDDLDEGFEHEGADEVTTIWNANAEGDGFAFGKLSELSKVLENMFKFFPIGGFMFPEFKGSTLMSPNIVPNVYAVRSGKDIEKSPFTGEYTLIVLPGGGVGDLVLIAITCDLEIKINSYANSSWSGNWKTLTVT